MKINSICIKNFRSIKDSGEIGSITKIFALIGRNNAGKSSFLKAIQVLLGERAIFEHDFHKGTDEAIEVSGALEYEQDGNRVILNVKVIGSKKGSPTYHLDGKEVSKTTYCNKMPAPLSISDIRNPIDSTTGGQKTTLLQKILKLQEAENEAKFAEEFKTLSTQIEMLKAKESRAISTRLTEKFKNIVEENSFKIAITPAVNLEKGIAYSTGITNENVPGATMVDILNSGTGIQSMYILSLLEVFGEMSEKDGDAILIIEEPEVYLHPDFQRRMFAAIRRIAKRNQVIFTTHSPIMIADIWSTESVRQVLLNPAGETKIEAVKIEDVIAELGIRYEDVLNPKLVVFVEGINDEKFYQKLGLDNPKITIIPTDSFRAIHYYAFIKIISSENVSSEFVLISDADGEDKEKRIESLKDGIRKQFSDPPTDLDTRLKDKIYILDQYAIESYFLNEPTLVKAFPEIDHKSIKTFLKEYGEHYKEQLALVREGKLKLETFQRHLKPKAIFEVHAHENAESIYVKAWEGKDTFLKVRGLITEACRQIGVSGGDYFEHLLESFNIEEASELIDKKRAILALLEN